MKRRKARVRVADHAVLRWLEREFDLDVPAIRAHLAGRAMNAAELGAAAVQCGTVRLVLKDANTNEHGPYQVIVTALPRGTFALHMRGGDE